jgi:TPR repeat protein
LALGDAAKGSAMKRLLVVLVLLWPVGAVADFAAGEKAYRRGDFVTAIREWLPLAEAGGASAQFLLGNMRENGTGAPKDAAEAVTWYRLAAEQGHAFAQYNLGVMYHHARGVPKDDVEAVKWFRLAAEQGDAKAQYNLGNMYYNGEGVPKARCRDSEVVSLGCRAGRHQSAGRPRLHVRHR